MQGRTFQMLAHTLKNVRLSVCFLGGGVAIFVDQVCFGSWWSFPNSFWEAPFCGWGVRKPTPEACLSVPSLSSPGAFLRGPGSPYWWPGPALWGGMQLHSDIPVAAQTQWHFVKSWATPSPLSVCWCCCGNQIPSLYVPPIPCLLQSAPSPTPLLWASSDPSCVAKRQRAYRVKIKTSSPVGYPRETDWKV